MTRREYYKLRGFEEIYLEDSYVLNIQKKNNEVEFVILAVLRENHPLYTPPLPKEQYCYRNGKIVFQKIKNITWHEFNMEKARSIDITGVPAYGNIDFLYEERGVYFLGGTWGEVSIESQSPKIYLFST